MAIPYDPTTMQDRRLRLWYDNRADQEWSLTLQEVLERFAGSRFAEGGRFLDVRLSDFLTMPESAGGLNSVVEPDGFQAVIDYALGLRRAERRVERGR